MTIRKSNELLDSFDTILLSYDYISWNNKEEGESFISLINSLRSLKKRIFFITTDSKSSRREIVEKLANLKIDTDCEEVICPTYLLAKYLSKLINNGKVFIIGSTGMSEELSIAGIQNVGSGADILDPDLPTYLQVFANEPLDFDAVVIGFDEHLSYPKLIRATTFLNNSKTIFLATSLRHPVNAFVSCVECSSEKKATVFEGSNDFQKTLYDSHNIMAEKTLYIGNSDRADILHGKQCGLKTLFVCNDNVACDDIKSSKTAEAAGKIIPDFCFQTLADLISISTAPNVLDANVS